MPSDDLFLSPLLAETLGATPILVGLLVASDALAQLIASPTIGRLSDRFGRRRMLIFSIVLAQAYITDVTDEKSRGKGLGMIGAAFGLGFIIGPAMGGILSNWGLAASAFASIGLSRYAVPAFAAVVLSALNLLGVIFWLPESLTPERRAQMAKSPRTAFTARAMFEGLRRPRFGPLLQVRFFHSFAFTLFTANFALFTQYRLGLTDQSTSYIMGNPEPLWTGKGLQRVSLLGAGILCDNSGYRRGGSAGVHSSARGRGSTGGSTAIAGWLKPPRVAPEKPL